MAANIILAVCIGSTVTCEAGIAGQGAFRVTSFPNTQQGISQLSQWVQKSGVREFDQFCVSGPPLPPNAATRFWASRTARVFLVDYAHVNRYMKIHNIRRPSAEVVAWTCQSLLPSSTK